MEPVAAAEDDELGISSGSAASARHRSGNKRAQIPPPTSQLSTHNGSCAQFRDRFRSLSNVNRSGSQYASKNAAAAAEKTE